MKVITTDKQYTTTDGSPARIYAMDGGGVYAVHGAVLVNGEWEPRVWTTVGKIFRSTEQHHSDDLVEAKPRIQRTFWVNVYPDSLGLPKSSRRQADEAAKSHRVACVKIEIDVEEGHGLAGDERDE